MVRAGVLGGVMLGIGLSFVPCAVSAQEVAAVRIDPPVFNFSPSLISASAAVAVRLAELDATMVAKAEAPAVAEPPMAPIVPVRPNFGGRKLLPTLFVSTAMTQALDLHSTWKALGTGATEGNPLMAGLTQNRAAFVAAKAAMATATILASRQIAKKHKVAAVVTLVAVNSAYALVAAHNYNLAYRR